MSGALEFNKENLKDYIEKNEIVIIDFWAPWCGPCRAFGPIFEKVADEYPEIKFGKVNTDVEQELAGAFRVRSIPTLAILKQQEVVFYQPGVLPEDAFKEVIQKVKELDMSQLEGEAK